MASACETADSRLLWQCKSTISNCTRTVEELDTIPGHLDDSSCSHRGRRLAEADSSAMLRFSNCASFPTSASRKAKFTRISVAELSLQRTAAFTVLFAYANCEPLDKLDT